jgi:hypothetical protein
MHKLSVAQATNVELTDGHDSKQELIRIFARGVRRHLQKCTTHLDSGGFGWLPAATGADITTTVNTSDHDEMKGA